MGTRLQRDERDGPDAAYLSRCGQRRLLQRAPHPTPGTATLRGGPQPRGTATQSPSGRPAPRARPESEPADGRRPCSLSQCQAELQGLPQLRFPQSADFEHGKCRHVDKPLSLRAVGQASTADRNRHWGHSEGRPQRSPEHAVAGLGLGSVDAGGAGEGQEQRARPEGTGTVRGKRHWTPEGAGRSRKVRNICHWRRHAKDTRARRARSRAVPGRYRHLTRLDYSPARNRPVAGLFLQVKKTRSSRG